MSEKEPRAKIGNTPVWCRFDELSPIGKLIQHPKNNNLHSKSQIGMLSKIILATGWRAPVTVSKRSGFIIKGHARLQAAIAAGIPCVPVEYQDYADEAMELSDLLADNKIASLAEFDPETTSVLLSDLKLLGCDLELAGFKLSEVDKLIQLGDAGKTDPDDIPEIDENKPQRVHTGDIWRMGEHRLMCADATDFSAAEDLMDTEMAAMVFTDPPYNVDYRGGTDKKLKIQNDKLGKNAFNNLIQNSLKSMCNKTVIGGGCYVCHADTEWSAFRHGFISSGWILKQCLIWEKNTFILGRQDYHWRHEPILYGWKPGRGVHNWYGDRKQDTVINLPDGVLLEKKSDDNILITVDIGLQRAVFQVPSVNILFFGDDAMQSIWKINKPIKSEDHPTTKPVALVERAIRNSSQPGEIVADWFGGSGSTLIACETTSRKARLMELDPNYCEVILKRWENFTGRQAERVKNTKN